MTAHDFISCLNTWGGLVLGLGAATLYWAVKHSGSLDGVAEALGLAGAAAALPGVLPGGKEKAPAKPGDDDVNVGVPPDDGGFPKLPGDDDILPGIE